MDQIVQLACALVGAKIGLVSVLGDHDLSFRSIQGMDASNIPADVSVTRYLVAMGPGSLLDIADALADPRFCSHPLVVGPTALRSYAGAAISTRDGVAVGSLAVMDAETRTPISPEMRVSLLRLAKLAGELYDQATARREQREQLDKLTLAEEMSGMGHWRLEPASGKLTWSDESYRIHGVVKTKEPLSMDQVGRIYHPEDQQLIQHLLTAGVVSGETYRLRIVKADGEVRVTQSSARCEYDEHGAIVAIFGVTQDITEREREHAALQKSETNYRLLADNLGDVVARLRLTGRIDYISPASLQLLGWRPDELVGQNVKLFLPPEAWAEFRKLMASNVAEGVGHRLQHEATKKDGAVVWVETDCKLVAQGSGPPEIVLTARDITERKRLEDESLAARQRAEAADQAKSEFLANMSHELRTPLTSVVGFSGVLLKSPTLSDGDRNYARRIATASDVLLGVINDILDYSKLEADAVEVETTVFDPRAMAEGTASIVETQCESRGVAMALDVEACLPPLLKGDVTKLRQVMLNFLSNAVKFTPEGEIRLSIGGQVLDGGEWLLRVEVSDTGVGISPDKMEQIFDRFTQADASTTRVYGGTGLGLAISRRLIELMGGSIGVKAREGGGSTFWFTAPVALAYERRAPEARPALEVPIGLRVLIADDAAPNRELVSVILQSMGIEVQAVCDGAQAVQAVQTGAYDLVLMDVHMPVLDGLGATQEIRKLTGGVAEIPIIALTANIEPAQAMRCREVGMNGLVGKPIQVSELVRALAIAAGDVAARSDPLPHAGGPCAAAP